MNIELNFQEVNMIVYCLKMHVISVFTYYMTLKVGNLKSKTISKIVSMAICLLASIVCTYLNYTVNAYSGIICLILSLSVIFSKLQKNDIGYSILIMTVSLSINYIFWFISIIITFIPIILMKIQNDYISFSIILITYIICIGCFIKIKKFKNGILILQKKLKNEYFQVLILNISVIILFSTIVVSNYEKFIARSLFTLLMISAITMFITIQKSLQLYYKQKLLIQDLEETKKELEYKKQEIEQLEKENLNFSKISHSIAHKQKSLEYKLNELMLKNEIATEIDIKDRINAISKELETKTIVELNKTGIPEIDDILKYMQAECTKSKIEFELQLSGNIHHMVNNYIEKESLEILLADHIKNAIIAINHSDNSNKNILVRLGIIDGIYSLYVYDSGIEFEIDTLHKLGKVPITTHRDSGGTGMGFMNTFDTLNKYKASMIINEYGKPCKDNYTKVIMIKFDKKNEFKIESYRSEAIEKVDNK